MKLYFYRSARFSKKIKKRKRWLRIQECQKAIFPAREAQSSDHHFHSCISDGKNSFLYVRKRFPSSSAPSPTHAKKLILFAPTQPAATPQFEKPCQIPCERQTDKVLYQRSKSRLWYLKKKGQQQIHTFYFYLILFFLLLTIILFYFLLSLVGIFPILRCYVIIK